MNLFVIGVEVGHEELADAGRRVGGQTVEGPVHHLRPVEGPVAQGHIVGDAHGDV